MFFNPIVPLKRKALFLFFTSLMVILLSGLTSDLFAQSTDHQELDTLMQSIKKTDRQMKQLNYNSYTKSKENFEFNVLLNKQNYSFDLLNEQIQKANTLLKEGIDYKGFTTELDLLVKLKKSAIRGIVTNESKMQTVRDLTSTSLLLKEILKRTNTQLKKISVNNASLSNIQRRMDSLAADKILYEIPIKEAAKKNYVQRMVFITNDLNLVTTNLKNAIDSIQKLEVKGKVFKYNLETDLALVNNIRKRVSDKISSGVRDVVYSGADDTTFEQNIEQSLLKGYLSFAFYGANEKGGLIVFLFFTAFFAIYLRLIRKKYIQANLFKDIKSREYVLNHPFAVSILIMISIFQFFIASPPFVVTAILWLISGLAITFISYRSFREYRFKIWLLVFVLNIIAIVDNLILLYTPGEGRFVLLMSAVGILFGGYVLFHSKKEGREFKEKSFVVAFTVFLVLQILALYFSIIGSYNLAKILMTNGYFTLLIIYQLFWSFVLSNDALSFSRHLSLYNEEDFDKDQEDKINLKVPQFVYVLFFIGWYILVSRNSYNFQSFVEPITSAYFEEKQFGELKFSFHSIFLFFFIIFLSGLSARIVTLLATDTRALEDNVTGNKFGSWLLLIRISLITIGVIIAFVFVGIPLDKITLMVSALSVGIGFGLQNLTNNLISGLIIAFEKPINLNDIVEVGGQTGKMKSIGIRSSVITTWDGADVIIPNGDLLSNQLINWTLGSSRRRFDLNLGVAYGSDLEKVTSIIKKVLNSHDLVLKNPEPMVWLTKFNDSSIDFAIKFWVPHFNFGNDVKNDLIIAIDVAFKANGIEIPFPQQDVHIRSNAALNNDENFDKN